MSEPQGSLIYLMQFLEGHLSASEAVAARRQLEFPGWQGAWERLQLAAVETTLPMTTWEEPTMPAETLAAFLEGSLPAEEAARVEQRCWDSADLLRELISTYRFLHFDETHDDAVARQPSVTATDRLLAMFPTSGVTGPPATQDKLTTASLQVDIFTAKRSGSGEEASSLVGLRDHLPVVVAAGRSLRSRRPSLPAWLVYAATIVIGLGLGLTAVVLVSRNQENVTGPSEQIATPSEGQNPSVSPEDSLSPTRDPTTPGEGPPQTGLAPATPPSPRLPGRPFDVADDGRPLDPDPMPRPPQRPSPSAVVKAPTNPPYQTLAVQWEKIDGLLVARDDDSQPWHGPYADVHDNAASDYATLPNSWASAKTSHGRIVLAEDTQIQLEGTRDALHVNVARGRVAMSELPPDQKVNLQVGTKSWIIQPMEADTALGCTVFASQTQLMVRRGRVSLAGLEIAAGRQVALKDDAPDEPTPITSSTSWFSRPDRSTKAPAAARDILLASRDVRADLDAIWRTDDHPARLFAARWALAIASDQTLAQALSARDDKLRLLALEWLLACQPNDPRVHLALRTLARQTDDPQMVRNVLQWLRAARTKSRVTRVDADRMVTGLRNDHLAIRQISAFFLENAFGRRVVFDPKAGPLARQRAAREWTAILTRADRATRIN